MMVPILFLDFFYSSSLEREFLIDYLGRWKESVEMNAGLSQDEKNRMMLSKQTLHGWHLPGLTNRLFRFCNY